MESSGILLQAGDWRTYHHSRRKTEAVCAHHSGLTSTLSDSCRDGWCAISLGEWISKYDGVVAVGASGDEGEMAAGKLFDGTQVGTRGGR